MTLSLPPRDPRVHVFSVSDGDLTLAPQTYLSQLSTVPEQATGLPDAFGAPVDATYAEVFAVEDIAPMRLRDYLAEAHGIEKSVLAPDAARLDGLSGSVAVLAPRAVEGVERLEPHPALTHIGSYRPAAADNTPRDLPPAARPERTAAPAAATGKPVQKRMIVWIVLAALVLAALLVLAF